MFFPNLLKLLLHVADLHLSLGKSFEGFKVTGLGWFFVRGVAMLFDRYLQADRNRARFSRII